MPKRSHTHWSKSSMEPVPGDMADAAMLLELNRELTELLSELVDRTDSELLHECLTILQRHLGVQAVGLYDFDSEWKLTEGVGGRSLVPLAANYFEEVLERNQTLYLSDEPAQGWGQFLLPFSSAEDRLDSIVLRLVGRKLLWEDLPTIEAVRDLFSAFLQLVIRNQQKHQQLDLRLELEKHAHEWSNASTVSQLLEMLADQLQKTFGFNHLRVEFDSEGSTQVDEHDEREVLWRSPAISKNSPLHLKIDRPASGGQTPGQMDWKVLDVFLTHQFIPLLKNFQKKDLEQRALKQQQDCRPLIGNSDTISFVHNEASSLIKGEYPLWISGLQGVGKRTIALHLARMREVSQSLISEFEASNLEQNWASFSDVLNLSISSQSLLLRNVDRLSEVMQSQLVEQLKTIENQFQSHNPCWLIVMSTSDLNKEVAAGNFREDLFRRFSLCALHIPPLRQRTDDILPLAEYFLRESFQNSGKKTPELSADACELLLQYRWPGNAAELRSVIQRLTWQGVGPVVASADLFIELQVPQKLDSESEDATLADATLDFQRAYIRAAISKSEGNMTEAAKLLGLHRTNFYRKINQLRIGDAEETQQED